MSYAPQFAWLQQTTIKNNIICCEPWDAARYKAVIHACALEPDLQRMLLGDETPIAEKGISLSGGQKQRVGLARAAYRAADVYVLDNPISALDDQTQEHIWTHLIEGLLQQATVIVGSSRPVISCTATVHVTADGLKQGEYIEFHNGWCDKRSKPVPPRYVEGSDKVPVKIRVAEPPAVPAHTSSESKLSAPTHTRRSRVGSSLMTVEGASVSDVTNEVRLYEDFAVSASKMSQKQIDAARSIRRVSVELQVASPDSQMQSLTRVIGNRSSFIDQQEESQPEKRSMLRSRRMSSYDSAFGSVRQRSQMDDYESSKMDNSASQLEVIVEPPIHASAVHITSAAPDTPDDYQPSSSDVGFLQWIHACNIGYSYGSFMVVSYFLYQVFRSYFSLVASWWKDLLFGLSSINFNWVLAGIVIAQLVFRVTAQLVFPLSLSLKADFVLSKNFSYVLFQSHVLCYRCHPTTWRTMQEQSAPSACAKLFARL
jgi:hypothetical protein